MRRGPEWAWDIQDRLDEEVGFLVGLIGLVALSGVVAAVVIQSFTWVCSWWGIPPYQQARVVGVMAVGVFLGGVGAGFGLGRVR